MGFLFFFLVLFEASFSFLNEMCFVDKQSQPKMSKMFSIVIEVVVVSLMYVL